jgi:hypothetical protein
LDGARGHACIAQDANIRSRVLTLTTFERDDYVFEALRAGVSGFMLKNASYGEMVHAVRVVAGGDALLAPSIARRVIEEYSQRSALRQDDAGLDRLTEHELEVLRLLATGKRATLSSPRTFTSVRSRRWSGERNVAQSKSSCWHAPRRQVAAARHSRPDDYLIAGGESGRDIDRCAWNGRAISRDRCEREGVAFFFKQWGVWGALSRFRVGGAGSRP